MAEKKPERALTNNVARNGLVLALMRTSRERTMTSHSNRCVYSRPDEPNTAELKNGNTPVCLIIFTH
jgi:hypothetical protein